MKYSEYLAKNNFDLQELLAIGNSTLIEDPPCEDFGSLPSPPFLMFDRITSIQHNGKRGKIVAEQDIKLDAWFFQCHFKGDPVQPGCLGVDAIWQLIGFYASHQGALGAGRALGSKEIEFFGQIRPHNKIVTYDIEIRRFANLPQSNSAIVIGTGKIFVDGEHIYTVNDAKVGMFRGIQYSDYPNKSEKAFGGQLERKEDGL